MDEAEHALAQLRSLVTGSANVLQQTGEWRGQAGSPAADEESVGIYDVDGTLWTDDDRFYGGVYLATLGEAMVGHLSAFAELLASPVDHYATPFAVCRVAVECAARAFWISSPDIDGVERTRRAFALRIAGLKTTEMIFDDLDMGEVAADVRTHLDAAFRTSARLGFRIAKDHAGQPVSLHHGDPGGARLIKDLFDSIPLGMSTSMWHYLSGVVHSYPYALVELRIPTGTIGSPPELEELVIQLVNLTVMAVGSTLEAGCRLHTLNGNDVSALQSWYGHTRRTIGRVRHDLGMNTM